MRKMLLAFVVLMLHVYPYVSLADIILWTGDTSTDWADPLNWTNDTFPGTLDSSEIRVVSTYPVISTGSYTIQEFRTHTVNQSGSVSVTLTGGTLNCTNVKIGAKGDAGDTDTFSMQGGTINSSGKVYLNYDTDATAEAIFDMSNGVVNTGQLVLPGTTSTAVKALFKLRGGNLRAGSLYFRAGSPDAKLDISDSGVLTLDGNQEQNVIDEFNAGNITAYDGLGQLVIDEGVTESGKTTVTAELVDPEELLKYNFNATGSIDRHVFDKAMEIVSVKDFNAVGDSVNDDTAAIQNAINYLEDMGIGGYVKFPAGKYKITDTLTVSGDGITLIGEGKSLSGASQDASVIVSAITDNNSIVINGDNSGLYNLAVYGSATASAGSAVSMEECQGSFVRNTLIENTYNGVGIFSGENCSVFDVYLRDLQGEFGIKGFGSISSHCNNALIRQIDASAGSNDNIEWVVIGDYSVGTKLNRLRTENGGRAISIESSDSDSAPLEVQISSIAALSTYNQAIKISSGKLIQLLDINIEHTDVNDGMLIDSGFSGGLSLVNIKISDAYKNGLVIDGADNIYITNPMIGNNSESGSGEYDGIAILGDSEQIVITGGKVGQLYGETNNQNYGIFISNSYQDKISIQGVDVSGNIQEGIGDFSYAYTVKRNNPGSYNQADGMIPFKISGSVNEGTYLAQWITGQKIRILGFTGKLSSGTCSIKVSANGTDKTGSVAVSTSRVDYQYSSPADIDATSVGQRIEVVVTGASGANSLEGGFYYVNTN